jgi:hypothetical protein
VSRWDLAHCAPAAVALALQPPPGPGRAGDRGDGPTIVRIVELLDAGPRAPRVDLTLAAEDRAEVAALLEQAEVVHLHGMDEEWAVASLPYVPPERLRGTLLVVHGPCTQAPARFPGEPLRLERWPGPVRRDGWAERARVNPSGRAPIARALDAYAAVWLPRRCAGAPIRGEGGRWTATIALDAHLPERAKHALQAGLVGLGDPQLRVVVWDEAATPAADRDAQRRAAQAAIVAGTVRSTVWLATALQQVPAVVWAEDDEPRPPHAIVLGGELDVRVDRTLALLRSWSHAWREGRPAPVELAPSRAWAAGGAWADPPPGPA